jgi:hypothetical protein
MTVAGRHPGKGGPVASQRIRRDRELMGAANEPHVDK